MMSRFFLYILDHRRQVLVIYLLAAVFSAFAVLQVKVNSDLTAYLPEDSDSTIALRAMEQSFGGEIPNTRLMVNDISFDDASSFAETIRQMPGVNSVSFVMMADYLGLPASAVTDGMKASAWRDDHALYTIAMDYNADINALSDIRKASGRSTAAAGTFVDAKTAASSSARELFIVIGIVVVFGIMILLLTLPSLLEPFLLVLCLMTAVLLNAGTNIIFGSISIITSIASSVLQMGVSVDYSIFLLHRAREYRADGYGAREAFAQAMLHSGSSILSSALTTAIGFLAITVMRYRIGLDMGLVLGKGILISLVCAFTLFPCLLLSCDRLVQKTSHRVIFRHAPHIAAFSVKVRIPAMVIFAALLVPAYLMQTNNQFYYGASHSYRDTHTVVQERRAIEDVFGQSNQAVLLVPADRQEEELALENRLQEDIPAITSLVSWPSTIGSSLLRFLVPDSLKDLFISEDYSRAVLSLSLEEESEETFDTVQKIQNEARSVFGENCHLAGISVSTLDLKNVISEDSLRVNLIALGAIFLVLAATFRSILVPAVLSLTIEGGIWINMAIPRLTGSILFYIGWLIVSSILLGFTVDYAILVTNRYLELRKKGEEKRPALKDCVGLSSVSVLTSGMIMIVAGILLGLFCTNQVIAQVGFLLARGTFIALVIVLLCLPGELSLLERFIRPLTRSSAPSQDPSAQPSSKE